MKNTILPLLSALTLAACTIDGTESVAKLGTNPAVSGGTYTIGGGITVAADMFEKDGKTLICGTWAESHQKPAQLKGKATQVISNGIVYIGSERVIQNLLFMRKIEPQHSYGGREANCQLTARPWQVGDDRRKPTIRIPQQAVVLRKGKSAAGQTAYFKQTGPGAGTPDMKKVITRPPIIETVNSRDRISVPMANDPFVARYTYKPYGEMMIAAMIREINGKVAVCGFWSKFEREQSYVKSTNLLHKSRANSKVTLNGNTIVQNLLFMNEIYKEDFASGTKAKCQQTALDWRSGYSNDMIEIKSPRLTTIE